MKKAPPASGRNNFPARWTASPVSWLGWRRVFCGEHGRSWGPSISCLSGRVLFPADARGRVLQTSPGGAQRAPQANRPIALEATAAAVAIFHSKRRLALFNCYLPASRRNSPLRSTSSAGPGRASWLGHDEAGRQGELPRSGRLGAKQIKPTRAPASPAEIYHLRAGRAQLITASRQPPTAR